MNTTQLQTIKIAIILIDILLVLLYIRSKDPNKSNLYLKILSGVTGSGCILLLTIYLIPCIIQ